MSTENKKITDAIISNDLTAFKKHIANKEDFVGDYSSVINALIFHQRDDFIKLLFQKYPDFALAKNPKGYNIAHVLALKDCQWACSVLEHLPDEVFHQRNNEGFTPFYTACAKSTDRLWEAFFNHPTTNINTPIENILGVNHLYLAVYSNDEKKVSDLLQKGANPNEVSSVLDLALEKKNWNIVGDLVHSIKNIPPKLILAATKDYPQSEKAMQSFIDDYQLQDKIFPLPQENKLSVWGYFFYYVSWDFLKKNEEFLKERFIPDFNKEPHLDSVVYSCFLGKRDGLNKFEWLLENTKMKWKSLGKETVSNSCTFNKELPAGYAPYFEKLSVSELKSLVKKNPSWLNSISREDFSVINLVLLSKGIDNILNIKTIPTPNFNGFLKAFDEEKKEEQGQPIQFLVASIVDKIPNNIVKQNLQIIKNICSNFKIVTDRVYEPFIDELRDEPQLKEYFHDFGTGDDSKSLLRVTIHKLLSEESSDENNKLLNSLSDFPYYKKNVCSALDKAFSDSLSNKKSKYKIRNFDFPGKWEASWDYFSSEQFYFPKLLNFISACNYSEESFKVLDKIDKSSWQFIEDGVEAVKQRFNYKDVADNLSLKTGINTAFLKKIKSIALSKTVNSVMAYTVALGIDNVEDEAYNEALEHIQSLDKKEVETILRDFSHSTMSNSVGIFEILKIAKSKDIHIPSVYWENLSKIEPEFYINTLSSLKDFSYFFDYLPQGNEVDSFKSIMDNKTPEFEDYLNSEAVSAWKRNASGFQPKDALFCGVHILTFNERSISNDELEVLKKIANKTFSIDFKNANSATTLSKTIQGKEFVDFLTTKNIEPEIFIELLDNTSLKDFSENDWHQKLRAEKLNEILNKNMSKACFSSEVEEDNSFKL